MFFQFFLHCVDSENNASNPLDLQTRPESPVFSIQSNNSPASEGDVATQHPHTIVNVLTIPEETETQGHMVVRLHTAKATTNPREVEMEPRQKFGLIFTGITILGVFITAILFGSSTVH